MRVAVYVLAALVFLAGLILDTGAVLELLGALLWAHARLVAAAVLLIVVAAVCRNRLGRGTGRKLARVKAAPRPAVARQQRKGSGRARKAGGKRKRAK